MRLKRIVPRNPRVEIYAKAEWANPGGSVKDRPARNMILDGERTGKLRPGKIILDATSGNTGHRLCHDRRGARLSRASLPARQRQRGAQATAARLRRASDSDRSAPLLRRRDPEGARALCRRSGQIFLSGPVQQPRELAGALRDHRARRSGSRPAGRITHFVAGPGHQRHLHGHRAPPARTESRHPPDLVSARFAVSWPGRHEVHGDLHRARHLRSRRWPTRTGRSARKRRTPW